MGFITIILCQFLLIHSALQCYQARLEFSDPAFGDLENAYNEENDGGYVKNGAFYRRSLDADSKRDEVRIKDGDELEDVPKEEESVERRRAQRRRANAEKRRISKHEGIRGKHKHKLNVHRKASEVPAALVEEEPAARDHETAHYYLSKPSDIANMSAMLGSAMLGPGPVPIPILDPTTQRSTVRRASWTPSVAGSSTEQGVTDKGRAANKKPGSGIKGLVSSRSVGDESASFVGDRPIKMKRKFKPHHYVRKNKHRLVDEQEKEDMLLQDTDEKNKETDVDLNEVSVLGDNIKSERRMYQDTDGKNKESFMDSHDDFVPEDSPKIGNRMFYKQSVHKDKGHKRKKNKQKGRKGIDKHYLNDQKPPANVSVINKGSKSATLKQLDKAENRPDDDAFLDRNEVNDNAGMEVDKICNEDSNEGGNLRRLREENVSLRDEKNGDMETENNNGHPREMRKGIKSKIEHGDWVYQVTLLPLPDYSIKRNRTHDKKRFWSFDGHNLLKNFGRIKDNSNKARKKKSTDDEIDNNAENFSGTAEKSQADPEAIKATIGGKVGAVLQSNEETGNEKILGDQEKRAKRHNLKLPKKSGIFNRDTVPKNEKDDGFLDADPKNDYKSYSNFGEKDENTYSSNDFLEKDEDSYEYDSNFNEKTKNYARCVTNKTTLASQSTSRSTSTTASAKDLQSKPTRKPIKSKTSPKPIEKPETHVNNSMESEQRNKSKDHYEMFLCGQLADSFVEEVIRKVKLSRKISRELGYTNETDETCDRCIELKPTQLPELGPMRDSLGKCAKSAPKKNCSMCCGVPKPMMMFLEVLVSFEKENENSLYSKIEDDSTFIFTGDYSEAMIKGGNNVKDKYVQESSFNKDSLDRQHLREDINDEKVEEKPANSDSMVTPKEKSSEDYNLKDDSGGDLISKDAGHSKENQSERKRYMRRFSKSKADESQQRPRSEQDENVNDDDLSSETSSSIPDSSVEETSYLGSEDRPDGNEGKVYVGKWKAGENTEEKYSPGPLRTSEEYRKRPPHNFDRVYGKSNYDYFKQYPQKEPQIKYHHRYKSSNYGDPAKNAYLKDGREYNGYYEVPNPNRLSNKDDNLNYRNNYFNYPSKKYEHIPKMDEKYKGFQSKYDVLYDENGEYSLYPNLEEGSLEEVAARVPGKYKNVESESSRMVKRYAESLPAYEEEPSLFFEIPIEYDLYK